MAWKLQIKGIFVIVRSNKKIKVLPTLTKYKDTDKV